MVLTVDAILSPRWAISWIVCALKQSCRSGCFHPGFGDFPAEQRYRQFWKLYIFFGLISAVGITFSGMVPHVFLVSEWFVSNRASAIGFVYAGTGVGILLLAPLSEGLWLSWGWPRRFPSVFRDRADIAITLGVGLLSGRTFRRKTSIEETFESSPPSLDGTKLALRSWQFWGCCFLRAFAQPLARCDRDPPSRRCG